MMELTPEEHELTQKVIGLAMKVHRTLGIGFVEFVYRNALIIELKQAGFTVESEKSMKVTYEGIVVGEFATDLVVNEWLIVELKAAAKLLPVHELQLVNYLTALNQHFGLLINFGAPSLEFQRKHRRKKSAPSPPPDLRE